jgi:hypothetical protein
MSGCLKGILLLVIPFFVALFLAVMLMVIYPNSLKAAAFMCPDDRPDTFVVRYDVATSDGTGTNWTLMCMSEQGEIYEVGTWKPLLVLLGIVSAVVYGFVLLLVLLRLVRGIDSDLDSPDAGLPPTAESFPGISPQPPPFST